MLESYFEERHIRRIDEIRGSIFILIVILALLTTPSIIFKYSVLPCGILLGFLVVYYGFIYRRIYNFMIQRKKAFNVFKHFQAAMNLLLIAVLIHFTGGMESFYSFIFIFEIIVSSFLVSWRESFLEASLAWLLYTLVLMIEYFRLLPHINVWPVMEGAYLKTFDISTSVARMVVTLYIAAFIGGYLHRLLQEKGQELEKLARKLAEVNLQLKELAITDGLTGLYNHRYFKLRLIDEVLRAQRYKHKLGIIMIDIDHFKQFNDKNGHPCGDIVIREIAKLIRSSIRVVDIPARYGGEEFVAILPETGSKEAMIVAERMRNKVANYEFPTSTDDSKEKKITISLGVASYPADATVPETLIERADQALYISKRSGRNRAFYFESPTEDSSSPKEAESLQS